MGFNEGIFTELSIMVTPQPVRKSGSIKECLFYEWETCSTDLQHIHDTTCFNTEMASHNNGYHMSGKCNKLPYSLSMVMISCEMVSHMNGCQLALRNIQLLTFSKYMVQYVEITLKMDIMSSKLNSSTDI